MPPSLASTSGMPNKDRSFHEAPQKAGGEGWLPVSSVATATGERSVKGNDSSSHFRPMGFLAVAGCMLLATAMSAALTSKASKA